MIPRRFQLTRSPWHVFSQKTKWWSAIREMVNQISPEKDVYKEKQMSSGKYMAVCLLYCGDVVCHLISFKLVLANMQVVVLKRILHGMQINIFKIFNPRYPKTWTPRSWGSKWRALWILSTGAQLDSRLDEWIIGFFVQVLSFSSNCCIVYIILLILWPKTNFHFPRWASSFNFYFLRWESTINLQQLCRAETLPKCTGHTLDSKTFPKLLLINLRVKTDHNTLQGSMLSFQHDSDKRGMGKVPHKKITIP